MKQILLILAVVALVGCDTALTMKSVAGTYGGIVWHENGIYEYTAPDGRKVKHKWEIVKGELHVIRDDQGFQNQVPRVSESIAPFPHQLCGICGPHQYVVHINMWSTSI